ncbi:MAG: hypothetical protein E7396_02625 [Ruminococcaceae bacterium]|nr:hypothetical protein [Oscillospiraceae bacterium]
MNVRNEMENYISTNENNGALLITGKWGCGKTYLLKQIADDLNANSNNLIVIISLFGIDKIDSFHQAVKESVFFAKGFEEHGEIVKNAFSKFKDKATPLINALSEYSKIAKGVNTALTINWQDFFTVEKEVQCKCGKEKVNKKLVLIFDDFERAEFDGVKLMGAINEYCENKEIKVIIVADENHINNNKYLEFKEKLISRTIKLVPDYDNTISSIINNYKEYATGYRDFLLQNIEIIQKLFKESGTENLRSLKSLLLDFERVYSTWLKTDVSQKFLPKVLYIFGAMLFTAKAGDYTEDEKYGDMFLDSKLSKKYKEWEGCYKLSSLKNWIVAGLWNKMDFIEEVNMKFNIQEMRDDEKFTRYIFWDLDQDLINKGMPVAVNKAYDGELCCDDLIGLLQKIKAMKKYDIPLPCDVDYSKISDGFDKRKQKIISNEVTEPKRRTFSEKHQVEEEAYPLYQKIEKLDNQLIPIRNKKALIDYLNTSQKPSYHFEGMVIGSFDSELMKLCFEKYCSANNAEKRELARLVIGLGFTDNFYINLDEFNETIKSLLELKEKLKKYKLSLNDYITITNVNEYIKEIEKLINNVNDCISLIKK